MEKEKIEKIANLYGIEHQNIKLVEEMAELTDAITKLITNIRTPKMREAYISELADVKIVLEQVIYLAGRDKVENEIKKKIERQIQRVEAAGIDWRKI